MKNMKFDYPYARPDVVYDYHHGRIIHDPYRWMEEPDSDETQAYIAAQNELTDAFISEIPARPMIHQRLTELIDYKRWNGVEKRGDRLFYWYNDGLQNQSQLFMQADPPPADASPTLLLDPNGLSEDGTVAVNSVSFSPDADYMAYTVAVHGSDWQNIHIRHVASLTDLPEVLEHCKFTSVAWVKDGSGFFYDRYPAKGSVPPEDESHYNAVYWHTLNTPQSDDVKIYSRPRSKELGFRTYLTDDGRFHIFEVWHGAIARNRLYYRQRQEDGQYGNVTPLIDKADAYYRVVGNQGDTLLVQTDKDAPKGCIVAIDIFQPHPKSWQTLVPEAGYVLDEARIVAERLILRVTQDVISRLYIYSLAGEPQGEIELPGLGSVSDLSGRRYDQELFFNFQSHLIPPSIYRYRFENGTLESEFRPEIDFPFDQFHVSQHFYASKDGTRVPIFLIHRRDIPLDGSHPTMLYGYGGFSVSIPPLFSVINLQWVEMGGVYAVANLRGGNEYGDEWHRGGMLHNKQNVFDDFIAAGEWLIEQGYTSSPKLAIHGRSNGGLLVAACILQRPDLFGAGLCGVPVIDMLRYHLFTAGRYWVPEYGDPSKRKEFETMMGYSPLHNVQPGVSYPPLLVYTAEADDRVVPMHSLKFIATIQTEDGGENPLLLRMDTKSGHGLGKPIAKVIDEYADLYAFLFQMLKMEVGT